MRRTLSRLLTALLLSALPAVALRDATPVAAEARVGSVGRYFWCGQYGVAAHSFPAGSVVFVAFWWNGTTRSRENAYAVPMSITGASPPGGYYWQVKVYGPNWQQLYLDAGWTGC
jgi:hypothetical protein